MDTKLAQVTQAVIDSLQTAKIMDDLIDSTDAQPTTGVGVPNAGPGTPTACEFTMRKDVDGTGRRPVGHIVYTITIKAEYVPFDEG
jgi:hypothetical protein